MQDEMSDGFQGFDGFDKKDAPSLEDAMQTSARLYALRDDPKLSEQERSDLHRLLCGSTQAGMQLQVLEQQLQRQVTAGMFVVAGQIWAAVYAKRDDSNIHTCIPDPAKIADIAADLVQEIYKR